MLSRKLLSSSLLAIALGFAPVLTAEDTTPDLASLEARHAELTTQLQELKSAQNSLRDATLAKIDISEALAAEAAAKQALADAMANDSALLAAKANEAEAKKAVTLAFDQAVANSPEMKAAEAKGAEVKKAEQALAFERGLALMYLNHSGSPLRAQIHQRPCRHSSKNGTR